MFQICGMLVTCSSLDYVVVSPCLPNPQECFVTSAFCSNFWLSGLSGHMSALFCSDTDLSLYPSKVSRIPFVTPLCVVSSLPLGDAVGIPSWMWSFLEQILIAVQVEKWSAMRHLAGFGLGGENCMCNLNRAKSRSWDGSTAEGLKRQD